jgi:hypothetical protein
MDGLFNIYYWKKSGPHHWNWKQHKLKEDYRKPPPSQLVKANLHDSPVCALVKSNSYATTLFSMDFTADRIINMAFLLETNGKVHF